MRVLVIVNSKSGGSDAGLCDFVRALGLQGAEVTLRISSDTTPLEGLAHDATQFDRVVAAGGDGTVSTVCYEVRNTGVSKGTGAAEWLGAHPADFILAIGDDWTDEDLFRALPPPAYTVRVGLANTAAQYHIPSHSAVRRILRELSESTENPA